MHNPEADTILNNPEIYPKNSIYLEVLGNSLYLASMNYERVFLQKNFFYLAGGIGIGAGGLMGMSNFSAPIHINGIFQIYKQLALEAGFGITFMRAGTQSEDGVWTHENVAALDLNVGIRVQNTNGVVLRWSFTPFYPINQSLLIFEENRLQPYIGFSVGRSFGKK